MSEFTKRSFTSGEISPSLRARNDLNKFHTALATCKNFITLPEGGVLNRPGFEYLGTEKKSSLIPFQFNQNDSYMLAFGDITLVVYRYGEKVHSVDSPYSFEDMTTAQFVQNADVVTIAHIDHPLRTLTRYAHDDWRFEEVSFSSTQIPPIGLTVKPTGTDSESPKKQYDYVVTSVANGKESGQSGERSITTNALSETWGNRLSWEGSADSFNIYKSVSPSTNVYGWIGNSKTNSFTDYNIAPVSSEGVVKQTNPFNIIEIDINTTSGSSEVGDTLSNADFSGVVQRISGDAHTIYDVVGKPSVGGSIETSRVMFTATGNITEGATLTSGPNEGIVVKKDGTLFFVEMVSGSFNTGDSIQISGNSKTTYKVSLSVPESSTESVVVNGDDSRTITTTTINRDGSQTVTTRTEFPTSESILNPNIVTTTTDADTATTTATQGTHTSTVTNVFSNGSSTKNVTENHTAPSPLVALDPFTSPNGASGTFSTVSALFGNEQSFTSEDITGTLKVGDTIYVSGDKITITDVYQSSITDTGEVTSASSPTFQGKVTSVNSTSNPSVINQYQQRLMLANTEGSPQTVYASRTSDYYDFRKSEPVGDSDSLEFTIASGQINEVRHIVSMKDMLLLTSSGVWLVTEGQNEVLTPASVGVRRLSNYGSSKVRPVLVGGSALFIEEKGSRIRDLYNLQDYQSDDISILSQHLFRDHEVVSWCYQEDPHGIIWAVRSDGALLGLTYHKGHQVWGWHVHETQGNFVSVESVTETDRDSVYVCIERDGKHYIERLSYRKDDDYEKFTFLDSYHKETFDTPTKTIARPSHLMGKEIVAVADGFVYRFDSNENVEFSNEVSNVVIGLSYESDLETLDIDPQGTNTNGKLLQIPSVSVKFQNTVGGYFGQTFDKLLQGKWRSRSDNYDPVALSTEDISINTQPGWNDNGRLCIRQKDPLPMHILAITPTVLMGGRGS